MDNPTSKRIDRCTTDYFTNAQTADNSKHSTLLQRTSVTIVKPF